MDGNTFRLSTRLADVGAGELHNCKTRRYVIQYDIETIKGNMAVFMTKVAILGFGIVGSGVAQVIATTDGLCLSHILEIRQLDGAYETLRRNSIDDVLADTDTRIAVETIGGCGVAYEFTKRLLSSGVSVVTSNKALVSKHGAELFALGAANGARYLFEASVGGGMPVCTPLATTLKPNRIHYMMGILNGTTNYILTKMRYDGVCFADALRSAQQKGYAEQQPDDDILAYDTVRKLAILSGIAYGKQLDVDSIPTTGVVGIDLADVSIAAQHNQCIKLIGYAAHTPGGVCAWVEPLLLCDSHPFGNVNGAYNAILFSADYAGDILIYGKGAGSLPTASAVVADILDIVRNPHAPSYGFVQGGVVAPDTRLSRFIVRYDNDPRYKADIDRVMRGEAWHHDDRDYVIRTEAMTRAALDDKLRGMTVQPRTVIREFAYDAE